MAKKIWLAYIVFLTLCSLWIRAYRISEPNHYYFDEVYHAVTAEAYAANNPAAYDPFSPPLKPGTAYEWLHPPFAKLLQAGSIKIFGDVPFAWRLPSLLIGTAIIPATFLLAYILFGPIAGAFAATTIAFENLTFVMSRITMNDIFVVFFTVCAFIFAALYSKARTNNRLLLTSIFLGLAIASKWTGLYAIAVVLIYLFINDLKDKKLHLRLSLLLIIPAFIYLASYGQFWLQGHSIGQFINLNKQIWWYENRHDLKHSYATTPIFCAPEGLGGPKTFCPWILDARGVYFSYEQYGQKAGFIYALGNPFIFWVGIIAISYMVGKYIENKDKHILLVLLGYFVFWVPWVFTPRILFLYHYLPSIPFLSVGLGYCLAKIYKTKLMVVSLFIIGLFILAFFYFYPITSGLPIDPATIQNYMWLSTWR